VQDKTGCFAACQADRLTGALWIMDSVKFLMANIQKINFKH